MTKAWAAAFAMTCLLGAAPALAQRSLFDQPVQNPSEVPVAPRAAPITTAPPPSGPVSPAPAPAPAAQAAPAQAAPAQAAPAQAAAAEAAPEAAAEPKAKARPRKPRGPVPARSLAVSNASPSALVALEVSQDGKSASLKTALAPGKKTSLRLPAFKGCEASVTATFEGGQPDTHTVDICKEKSLTFKG